MLALLFLCKLAVNNGQYLPTAAEYDINKWQWGEGGVLEKAVVPNFAGKSSKHNSIHSSNA
jgi:hypothetical protein